MGTRVTTGDGQRFELNQTYSGAWVAEQPGDCAFTSKEQARSSSRSETLRTLSDTHGGIKKTG